jgi:hypothetical protein
VPIKYKPRKSPDCAPSRSTFTARSAGPLIELTPIASVGIDVMLADLGVPNAAVVNESTVFGKSWFIVSRIG